VQALAKGLLSRPPGWRLLFDQRGVPVWEAAAAAAAGPVRWSAHV